jgi:hypothetical protein
MSTVGNLWWGRSTAATVTLAADGSINSPGETMTFSGFTANQAVWTGSTSMPVWNGFTFVNQALDTRFELTLNSATGGQTFAAAPSGIANEFDLQVLGDFQVNLKFLARAAGTGNAFIGVDDLFNSAQTPAGLQTQKNFAGAFYWTAPASADAAPVPLPATAVGGITLLGGLGMTKLRRRLSRKA